jgi:hypothetical protein
MQLNKLYLTTLTMVCAELIAPRSAFPIIGRTGNGAICDLVEGYTAQVPVDFNQISLADKGAVILNSDYMIDPQFGGTENIQATPFSEVYPDQSNMNSASVLAFFQAAPQMTYTVISTPNCSLSLLGEGVNTWVGVSTWGNGNGYILTGLKTDEAKQAILSMLQDTEITPACWK